MRLLLRQSLPAAGGECAEQFSSCTEQTRAKQAQGLGGAEDVRDSDLGRHYELARDPRLNAHQAVELGLHLIDGVRRRHHPWFWAQPQDQSSHLDSDLRRAA